MKQCSIHHIVGFFMGYTLLFVWNQAVAQPTLMSPSVAENKQSMTPKYGIPLAPPANYSEDTTTAMDEYRLAKQAFAASPFSIADGKVINAKPQLSEVEKSHYQLIQAVYPQVLAVTTPQNGKVAVLKMSTVTLVLFEYKSTPNERGPSYSAKVVIDPKNGQVLRVALGG